MNHPLVVFVPVYSHPALAELSLKVEAGVFHTNTIAVLPGEAKGGDRTFGFGLPP